MVKRVVPNRQLPESVARIEQEMMQCCEELRRTEKVKEVVRKLEQQVSEAFDAFQECLSREQRRANRNTGAAAETVKASPAKKVRVVST